MKNDANYARIMGLITLADPDDGAQTSARFDDARVPLRQPGQRAANQLRGVEFVRLLRFIRLWRKLGWTIEQTDKAIAALYPADQTAEPTPTTQRTCSGSMPASWPCCRAWASLSG